MKQHARRAAFLIVLGLMTAAIASGCTLSGATEAPPTTPAPPPVTPEAVQPTLTATRPVIIGTPTPIRTIDAFGTLTQQALLAVTGTPGVGGGTLGATTGTPFGGTPRPGGGTPSGVTPTAKPPVTGGTGTCPSTYTIQSGDTLFRIALKFNLTVAQLAAANGIANPDMVLVGTVLKIPGCGAAATQPPVGTGTTTTSGIKPQPGDTVDKNGDILHTVKSGENLFRIALAYNLSWQKVAAYNGITSPDEIVVGQVIRIPTK